MTRESNIFIILGEKSEFHHKLSRSCVPPLIIGGFQSSSSKGTSQNIPFIGPTLAAKMRITNGIGVRCQSETGTAVHIISNVTHHEVTPW